MSQRPVDSHSEGQHERGKLHRCHHTLYLKNEIGKPVGSWIGQRTSSGFQIVCRYCQKFYGYRTVRRLSQAERLRLAYLEEQWRSCNDCVKDVPER